MLSFGVHASKRAVGEEATLADEEGYYSLWAAERVLVPVPPNQPWSKRSPVSYEPISLLSYLAAITHKIKLGTGIIIAPFRNPILLARGVATIDVLSGGRTILGVGLGWMKEEFDVSNVPIKERGPRTDETIRLLRTLWEDDKPSFRGRFTSFGQTLFEPKPVQKRIPIWIGGETIPALKRVGRLGDGWLRLKLEHECEEIKNSIKIIKREAERNGRSMNEITLTDTLRLGRIKSERASALKRIEKLQEIGVNDILVDFDYKSASEYARMIKLFSSEIMKSF